MKEKEFASAILNQPVHPGVKLNKYLIEFYDNSPIEVKATDFTRASILAKAFMIHKMITGWEVRKITNMETKSYIGDEPDKFEKRDAYDYEEE